MTLKVPAAVEAILRSADDPTKGLDEWIIFNELLSQVKAWPTLSEPEQRGAAAESIAWHLERSQGDLRNPWGLYWKTHYSDDKVPPRHIPDIAQVDDEIIEHWSARTRALQHPLMTARYADLVWTVGKYLKRSPEKRPACSAPQLTITISIDAACLAIDKYLETVNRDLAKDGYHAWLFIERAAELAVAIQHPARIDAVKEGVFEFHRRFSVQEGFPFWWKLDAMLTSFESKLNLTSQEKAELLNWLRKVLNDSCDQANAATFEPDRAMFAANRLIGKADVAADEVKKIVMQAGRAKEHFAQQAKALIAQSVLADVAALYRKHNLTTEVARIERIIRSRASEAQAEMTSVEVPFDISENELRQWVKNLMGNSITEALAYIGAAGLVKEGTIKTSLQELARVSPLRARLGIEVTNQEGFAESHISSVEDDLNGRAIRHAADQFDFLAFLLNAAYAGVTDTYSLDIEAIMRHIQQAPFFPSERSWLLREGLLAWSAGDCVKAIHILVPQVEAACRELLVLAGVSVRVPNTWTGGTMVKGMGDVLRDSIFQKDALKDVGFHFRALYTDPRGLNLRNNLAHGLVHEGFLGMGVAHLVVHSLLLLATFRIVIDPPESMS